MTEPHHVCTTAHVKATIKTCDTPSVPIFNMSRCMLHPQEMQHISLAHLAELDTQRLCGTGPHAVTLLPQALSPRGASVAA